MGWREKEGEQLKLTIKRTFSIRIKLKFYDIKNCLSIHF
jgi:hypothetical protein